MKILITGGKGQLGTEIYKCFTEGKTALGIPKVLKEKNVVHQRDVDTLDITDLNSVLELFNSEKYDAVINCAAYTNVNGCESERDLAFKVNAIGPRNLAIASERIGAKLVQISTDYVFSGDGNSPYVEWDLCNPQSAYGKSKLLGENYVREHSSKYFIVRTAWLYGYYGNNFVKTMIKINSQNGGSKVVCDQRGNPTNCEDLAHHILKLLTTEEYGIYHATGNGECSWYDFARKIVELAKINAKVDPCTTEEYPTPAKRPAYSSLDNMMLRSTVGDEFRSWEEALKEFIINYKNK